MRTTLVAVGLVMIVAFIGCKKTNSLERTAIVSTGPIFDVNLGESVESLGARRSLTRAPQDNEDDPADRWSVATTDESLARLLVRSLDGTVYAVEAQMKKAYQEDWLTIEQVLKKKYGEDPRVLRNGYEWEVVRGGKGLRVTFTFSEGTCPKITYVDETIELQVLIRMQARINERRDREAQKLKGKL